MKQIDERVVYDEGWRLGQIHAGAECWNFFPEDPALQQIFAKGWTAGQEWYEEKQGIE